ncbi:MAG: hypothetical protein AB2L24_33040 [Mangrovibacterium sp.]
MEKGNRGQRGLYLFVYFGNDQTFEFIADETWREDPVKYIRDITQYLEERIDFRSVKQRDLSEEEWNLAKNVGTNLTSLSKKQIDCLVRHAENLTKI